MITAVTGKFYIANHASVKFFLSKSYPSIRNVGGKSYISYPWELTKVTLEPEGDLYAIVIRSAFGTPRITSVGRLIPDKRANTTIKILGAEKFNITGEFRFEIIKQNPNLPDFIVRTKKEKTIWF